MGSIGWVDLTVPNADEVRDFYAAVVGWKPEAVGMGGYNDYHMCSPGDGKPAAGVCHKRGGNADLPGVWMVYLIVADLDASLSEVSRLGGKLLTGPKGMGGMGRYAVIEDPAGAVCALWQPG